MQNVVVKQLQHVIDLVKQDKIDEAKDLLVHSLKDYSQNCTQETQNFALFEKLLQLDRVLKTPNREVVLQGITSEAIPNLPAKIDFFINDILRQRPKMMDQDRIQELKALSDSKGYIEYAYVLAASLCKSATEVEPERALTALTIMNKIAPEVEPDQEVVFAHQRSDIFYHYISSLSLDEQAKAIDEAMENGWFNKVASKGHFIIRRASIKDAVQLHAHLKKDFEELTKNYQNQLIVILSLFVAILTISVAGLQLINKTMSLYNGLTLILGLCLGIAGLFGLLLGAVRKWTWICYGLLALFALCMLAFINMNN